MKNMNRAMGMMILAAFLLMSHTAYGQTETSADKTLSPYFLVKSDDPEVDQLPLKSTSAQVNISGVIADVVVTQVYKNEGKRPIEAVYVFPASTRAAVYGMKMTIGERTITAKIREREAARREYDQAKQQGKSASLLQQQRPNVFQMNVANILPKDIIKVELKYTELLVPTDTVYEFVYPTVVGPRYSEQPADTAPPSEQWIENPYLHEGEPPTYTFDTSVNIAAGLSIKDVTCPTHKVNISYDGSTIAKVALDESERHGGNRDFILKYRLAGGKIETGLLLFEGEKENFFLLMMQPPKRIKVEQIPKREYVFIVDVSGSMHGFPLKKKKKLIKDLISNLRTKDRFNVLLFAGGSSVMSEKSLPANQKNIKRAIDLIDRQRGGGGTRLLPALKRALALPGTEGYSRSIVIATDGYVSVEEEAFDLIRNNLGEANMFAFGIGSSVNRHIIEGMARVGMGEPFIITKPEEAPSQADKFRALIQSPVLTGIEIDYGKFRVHDVEPPSVPDVLAERPVIVFGKWQGKPKGSISLKGITGKRRYSETVDIGKVKPLKANSALRYLWARHRIAILSDYNRLHPTDERVKEVTRLGLTYNLLTAYTSFVAVDTKIRVKDGQAVTVKQPLPLPQGVSDYAVGGRSLAQRGKASRLPASPHLAMNGALVEEKFEWDKEGMVVDALSKTKSNEKTKVEMGKIIVTDGLSKEKIRDIIERQIPSIHLCYGNTSGKQEGSTGTFTFRFMIDKKGQVKKIRMDKALNRNEGLESCIVKAIEQLQFPVPEGDHQVMVTVSFVLK